MKPLITFLFLLFFLGDKFIICGKKNISSTQKITNQCWTHDPDGNKIELMQLSEDGPQMKFVKSLKD